MSQLLVIGKADILNDTDFKRMDEHIHGGLAGLGSVWRRIIFAGDGAFVQSVFIQELTCWKKIPKQSGRNVQAVRAFVVNPARVM